LWSSAASNSEPQWALTQQTPFDQLIVQQHMVQTTQMEGELGQLRNQMGQAQQLINGYEGRLHEMEAKIREYEHAISG
jgi:hypothetical protein